MAVGLLRDRTTLKRQQDGFRPLFVTAQHSGNLDYEFGHQNGLYNNDTVSEDT